MKDFQPGEKILINATYHTRVYGGAYGGDLAVVVIGGQFVLVTEEEIEERTG